jgi:hypothetical protein
MSEFEDALEKEKLPSGINVLTILTFIGSGLGFVSAFWTYFKSADNLAKMEEMINKPEFAKLPDFAKKFYSPEAMDLMRKMDANKLPIMVITIISCLLCTYGAVEVRKLKKSGFYTYTIGELLPFIGVLLFIGSAYLGSGWTAYLGIGLPILFVILYATQLKHLVNK